MRDGAGSATHPPSVVRPGRSPVVVIPVHDARIETLRCLASLARSGVSGTRCLVVDDASRDVTLRRDLDRLARTGQIRLMRNEENLGFAASVNRAIAACADDDIVLLNSDTIVCDDWLARLRRAAYSHADIGTVTPWSNEGGLSSYPQSGGSRVAPAETAHWHALVRRTLDRQTVELPSGNGFCLYLRRDSLDAAGGFDAAAFGPGYGEETDLCLRARALGWRHLAALDVFVYHQGGASFGARQPALLARSDRLLQARHPGFERRVDDWIRHDPLMRARRALDEARVRAHDGHWVVLVSLAEGGGVDRRVAERREALSAEGLCVAILRPASPGQRDEVELMIESPAVAHLRYNAAAEVEGLAAFLATLTLHHLEIHHFIGLDESLLEALLALGTPFDVHLHDYAWFCPQVTLVDATGRYCGEPDIEACVQCGKTLESALGDRMGVRALRRRSARWLKLARQVHAPSADCAARYATRFPGLPIVTEPLSRPRTRPRAISPPGSRPARSSAQRLRVGLIGALTAHKGLGLLLACALDAATRDLDLEFVLIGHSADDTALMETRRVSVSGKYEESEVGSLIERSAPDLFFMASVWPETWCYALDPVIESGLPVVAFDLGAIAERLRASPTTTFLPLAASPTAINDALLLAGRRTRVPLSNAPIRSTMQTTPPAKSAPANALTAAVETLPVANGLYLFSVVAGPAAQDLPQGELALPAALISVAPGLGSNDLQIIEAPQSRSPWLCFAGDQLIARITGRGTTLLITSVRDGTGRTLSIKAERLESRLDAAPAAPSMARTTVPGQAQARPRMQPPMASPAMPAAVGATQIITTHLSTKGDRSYRGDTWAGCEGPGIWVESFSLMPPAPLTPADIEYKALTTTGFETPWTSGAQACGTRGLGVALLGFAIRLKGDKAREYDVEYRGRFQSAGETGICRNGVPCRSSAAGDPLAGLRVSFVHRAPAPHKPTNDQPVTARQPMTQRVSSSGAAAKTGATKGVATKRAVTKGAVTKGAVTKGTATKTPARTTARVTKTASAKAAPRAATTGGRPAKSTRSTRTTSRSR